MASQVEAQLKGDRARIAAEEARKTSIALTTDLEEKTQELSDLQELLNMRDAKLARRSRCGPG